MSTDKKPEDQITEASAVELDESQLDDAAGGAVIAVLSTPPDPVRVETADPPDPVRSTTIGRY